MAVGLLALIFGPAAKAEGGHGESGLIDGQVPAGSTELWTLNPGRGEDSAAPGALDEPGVAAMQRDTRGGDELSRLGAWPFGPARAAAEDAVREIVFYGVGGAVRAVDASDPNNPAVLSDAIRTGGVVQSLCFDPGNQTLLVAAERGGLEIWDVSDVAAPALLSQRDILHSSGVFSVALDVELHDDIAYVAGNIALVRVFDVSDPGDPVDLGITGVQNCKSVIVQPPFVYAVGQDFGRFRILGPGVFQHFSFESNLAINGTDCDVRGNHAYVVKNGFVLILDLTSNFFPTVASYAPADFYVTEVEISGSHLFVGDAGDGVRVLDLASPTSPVEVASYAGSGARTISVAGDRMHTTWAQALDIFDVSDPANPQFLGEDQPGTSLTYGVAVRDDYVYAANSSGGLFIVDVSNPALPVDIGHVEVPGLALNIAVEGSYAYIASQFEGLQIADISDPGNPVAVGSHAVPFYARGVDVSGGYAYIADLDGGLLVYDVSDPMNPVEVAQLVLPDGASRVIVRDGIAYCACDADGVRIVDVSTPSSPVLLSGVSSSNFTTGVALSGSYLFTADFGGGMRVIDVSTPSSPFQVASYAPPGIIAWGVDVQGDRAFLTCAKSEVFVFDVMDPTNPQLLESTVTAGAAFEPVVLDGRVYLADGEAGVAVYQYLTPTSVPEGAKGPDDTPDGAVVNVDVSLRRGSATFRMADESIQLDIFDVLGRQVRSEAGVREVSLAPSRSGVYLWRAVGKSGAQTGQVVIVR